MDKDQEKQLTKRGPLDIMCDDIRAIVNERNCYGVMYYPTMRNPAIIITHSKDSISQVDVLFDEVKFDKAGNPILPERRVTYRAE